MGEGDGTVSLLSLGAMCVEGWKRKRWNPAGVKITTVEVRVLIYRSEFIVQSSVSPTLSDTLTATPPTRDNTSSWRSEYK